MQGKWGVMEPSQTESSKKRERDVIDARRRIEDESGKVIHGQSGRYKSGALEYKYDPFGFGEREGSPGLAKGFAEEYDTSQLNTGLESVRDTTLQKLSDYLGEGTTASKSFTDAMYGDPEMTGFTDPTTADIAEGTMGKEKADIRDQNLEDLRKDIESGLRTNLDISSPLESLEQQRVRSGMAYHGGLESQRRALDVTQQEYQREGGVDYATGKAEGEKIYQDELETILSTFKGDVLNPWKDKMIEFETAVGSGADEYRDFYAGKFGMDPMSLLKGSDPWQDYHEKNWAAGRGKKDRWALPDPTAQGGERYWGGQAGDVQEMSGFESQRSKSELTKAFPTLKQILG
jgi:hypothetical protein